MERPVLMQWDGERFEPKGAHFRKLADEMFVVGEFYPLVEQSNREPTSHSHYFARLREMWKTLPDGLAEEFYNQEKLRKHALIRTGYFDEAKVVFPDDASAALALGLVKPLDDYAICWLEGPVLMRWTAKSQAYTAMGKKDFMRSKYKVLGWVADLLRLPADDEHRDPGEGGAP